MILKIIIIPYIMASIISCALSLTGMSVKGAIFQPHSSHGSVTFLLTEAQNGNYFSFHYELSLFHLGTAMIDFHSSSILPFLKPLTQTDTMQNARDLEAYVDNFSERYLLVLGCCFKYILKNSKLYGALELLAGDSLFIMNITKKCSHILNKKCWSWHRVMRGAMVKKKSFCKCRKIKGLWSASLHVMVCFVTKKSSPQSESDGNSWKCLL